MVRSRTRFLERGLYSRISDGINTAVARCIPDVGRETPFTILDAGCGEGFYLERLKSFFSQRPEAFEYYGVDISKSGVRRAARRDRTIHWIVAGVRNLPFAGSCLDVIMNIFSPAAVPEFSRVLANDGLLITATPGPRHLNGLRELIYADAREHPAPTITRQAEGCFFLSSEERITYPLELKSRDAIVDLLAMTPYYWNVDRATRARIEALDRLSLDVDVEIRTFRNKHSADACSRQSRW
jgi:23S rRNA (guanine745-N1)-methyltransferase